MGWTTNYSWKHLKDVIKELTQNQTNDKRVRECLAHCYRGASFKGTLWTVWLITKPDGTSYRYIGCDLIQYYKRDGECFGYKDLEAGMGPYQINCPLSYLLMEKYDYDYEKGTFIEWVGRVLSNYKKKDSPLYKKALKAFPNAIQIHLDEKAKRDSEPPFIPKKMVHFSEIMSKEMIKEMMKISPIAMLEADDKAYDQMIIDQEKNLTNPE